MSIPRISLVALLLSMAWMQAPTAAPGGDPDVARVFESFQRLAGRWRGQSTKGWDEVTRIRAIAGGSVVVFDSFDAHPGEEMITAIHRDGERLMLTHYCIAGNQPRLVLTSVGDGGRRLTFTFLDGTGLASRDQGHMDQVVYRFHDDDHFSSRWTWYQDGEESWMEEIHYHRLAGAAPTERSPVPGDAGAPPR